MAKYQAIAEDLGARIRSGEYPPGSALPAQRELSGRYGVTLATLRQALGVLEASGLLSQQAGRGTFVAEPAAAYQLTSLRSLADDLREQGHPVQTEVVRVGPRRPPGPVAAQLAAGPGTAAGTGAAPSNGAAAGSRAAPGTGAGRADGRALRLERVRLLAGRPAIHQVSWVREPFATRLRGVDFTVESLYGALAVLGVVVHRASERLRPAGLDTATAALLHQPEGTAAFVSERITYGLDGTAVVVDRATILGSAVEIRTERAATGLSLQWHRHH